MYDHVVIEISGKCNARCKWCVTGRRNRVKDPLPGVFMEPDMLARAIDHMRDTGIMSEDAVIFLYNWGEPFLHPRFKDIVKILTSKGHEFVISSNLSRWVPFEGNALHKLRAVVISMPGFSQDSYNRIHGFSFELIKKNIKEMLENYRACGFTGKVQIKSHVYQFNVDELQQLLAFAREHDIGVQPTYASFADLKLFMRYLGNEMDVEELGHAARDLFLNQLARHAGSMPEDYECPYYNALILDEHANIVTCCMVTKEMDDFVIGNLFDTAPEDIDTLKRSQPVCNRCMELEIPYLIENRGYPTFLDEMDISFPRMPGEREIWLWGAGRMARELCERLPLKNRDRIRYIKDALSSVDPDIHNEQLVSPEDLEREDKPYVVVANEYIRPSVARLEELGYRYDEDYVVANIVSRG